MHSDGCVLLKVQHPNVSCVFPVFHHNHLPPELQSRICSQSSSTQQGIDLFFSENPTPFYNFFNYLHQTIHTLMPNDAPSGLSWLATSMFTTRSDLSVRKHIHKQRRYLQCFRYFLLPARPKLRSLSLVIHDLLNLT